MIVVTLRGGLGNQMFQYATGRALALRRDQPLYLDLSWFDATTGATPRRYELGALRVEAAIAEPALLRPFERRARGHLRIVQQGRHYDPRLAEAHAPHLWLDGYWQCERYFADQRARLVDELAVAADPAPADRARLERIAAAAQPVALHVRRGDYVTDARAAAHHGCCSLDYYRQAVAQVRAQLPDARFFAFTDDPEWVSQHLDLGVPLASFSDEPGRAARGWEDLRLMRRCRGFIIANSSFSWWGAWLGGADVVVAPRRWFADGSDEGDIVPARWTRL